MFRLSQNAMLRIVSSEPNLNLSSRHRLRGKLTLACGSNSDIRCQHELERESG
jgi:hypothetical protein